MKVIAVTEFGGADVLRLEDRPDPVPLPHEALIRIAASGVGFVDVMARQGNYIAFPEPGFIPGLEIAGHVVTVGNDVDPAWIGRRVFAMPMQGGGYAELVALPAAGLIPVPEALRAQDAVAIGMNGLVATAGIERVGVRAGERVLVRGAGGGIGLMAVQACAARGARVTATSSSESRGERLLALGAERIIGHHALSGEDADRFDVIVDTICGPDLASHIRHLDNNGRYLLCGGVEGAPAPDFGMALLDIFHTSPSFVILSLNSLDHEALARAGTALFADHERSAIHPVIDRELPLGDAGAAHRALESGDVFGKLILAP